MLKPVLLYRMTVRDDDRYNPARKRLRDDYGTPVDQIETLLVGRPKVEEVAGWIADNLRTMDSTIQADLVEVLADEPGWFIYRFNTGTVQDFAVKVGITADGSNPGLQIYVPEETAEDIYSYQREGR